jgi:hypothetical protein
MKKILVSTLFLTLLFIGILSDDKENVSADLSDLIEEIEKATNKNWSVEYRDKECILLRYKKEIMGFVHLKSAPEEKEPKVVYFEFYLYIHAKVSPEKFIEYKKEVKDNYENLKKASLEQIKNEILKGEIHFYPNNENERELYQKYLKAKKAYQDIPEYYYKNLGIIYRKNKSISAESKEHKEIIKIAEEQEQVILKLLTKYKA